MIQLFSRSLDQTRRTGGPAQRTARNGTWAAVIAFLPLLLCATSPLARPLDEIIEDGNIYIAVYRDFPPFSYERGGDLVGIDVDLGKLIASRLGVPVSFMPIAADESVDDDLRNAVSKGHYIDRKVADLMLHVPYDRQLDLRNEMVSLGSPYFRREIVMAYDPERIGGPSDPDAFAGEKVGVEVDTLADFYLSSANGGTTRENAVRFSTVEAATRALIEGDVAAVMAPRSQIEAGLGDRADRFEFEPLVMAGFARPTWLVGVAVREDSRDLGYAVEDIIAAGIANGDIERIFAAHGISYRPPYDD